MSAGTSESGTGILQDLRLGTMIRELRRSKETEKGVRLTQAQAAELAGVSVSTYSKWEEGVRRPIRQNLDTLCKAMGAEEWRYQEMMSLVSGSSVQVGAWPPKITPEEIMVIESFPFPAIYRKLPECEIIYSNQACLDTYPMFRPAPSGSSTPANMIEIMLTDWRSRVIFVDWQDIAHRMVYVLKLWSHGVISERLTQIVETCSQVPEFDHMWHTDPLSSLFDNNSIGIRSLGDDSTVTYKVFRSWFPNHQSDEYEILIIPDYVGADPQA
ncbi:helix-turn-helix domain-containing protein [Nocardia sp. 004]|uniref:helix-turn-helix domain-containing protein n=1 Tax=Nocardia sp. 004 TaxID=3385978 RepID=UPI0039A24758